MEYPRKVEALLKRFGAEVGDEIKLKVRGRTYEGIVMPHHAFSGQNILTLKLANGYNIGIEVDDDAEVQVLLKRGEPRRTLGKAHFDPQKPLVSFLGTGGTIASYVDYRTGAVYPAMTAEELIFSAPELADICNVRARVVYNIFSEDMKVRYWQKLAREVASELNSGARAVIIPHGTDTLGFTAAALSFMLRDLNGPVVLVGAQRSSDRPSSDAFLNLVCSARLAPSDLGEVVVAMHGTTSDTFCTIHRGTKVRKLHTSRRDAFKSVNEIPMGRVYQDGRMEWDATYRKRVEGEVRPDTRMEENVSLVYFYPGMKPEVLEAFLERSKGTVIAGTGLGHVASNLLPPIKKAVRNGVPIVMTSQCLHGRVGVHVYSRGRDLLKAGVIPGEDILPETALVKLMWVLGRTLDLDEVKRIMTTNLVGEISDRTRLGE